jgi:hypothetical protein
MSWYRLICGIIQRKDMQLYFGFNCFDIKILFLLNRFSSTMPLSHGPNKAFLVPDSCGATERNGNSKHTDVTDDTIEND